VSADASSAPFYMRSLRLRKLGISIEAGARSLALDCDENLLAENLLDDSIELLPRICIHMMAHRVHRRAPVCMRIRDDYVPRTSFGPFRQQLRSERYVHPRRLSPHEAHLELSGPFVTLQTAATAHRAIM
jgi:hypothetical protein